MLRQCSIICGLLITSVATTNSLQGGVLCISHRGNQHAAPENTVAAFVAAQGKSDFIESDVRITSDGQLVIMHDESVNRTTDGSGMVSNLTFAQIRALDAGSWFSTNFAGEKVPTFAEMVTNILPNATPFIEQKDGPASAYVTALQQLGVTTNVVLQSFNWPFLKAVHSLDPSIPLCAIGNGEINQAKLYAIKNSGARFVAWEQSDVNSNTLSMVHDAGLILYVWTVNGPGIETFMDIGVDGIITDDLNYMEFAQRARLRIGFSSIKRESATSQNLAIEFQSDNASTAPRIFFSDTIDGLHEEILNNVPQTMAKNRIKYLCPVSKSATGFFWYENQ